MWLSWKKTKFCEKRRNFNFVLDFLSFLNVILSLIMLILFLKFCPKTWKLKKNLHPAILFFFFVVILFRTLMHWLEANQPESSTRNISHRFYCHLLVKQALDNSLEHVESLKYCCVLWEYFSRQQKWFTLNPQIHANIASGKS